MPPSTTSSVHESDGVVSHGANAPAAAQVKIAPMAPTGNHAEPDPKRNTAASNRDARAATAARGASSVEGVRGLPPQCSDCPPGGVSEGEGQPCGIPDDAFNGGCNSTPDVFSLIECGQTVCGTSGYDGEIRDTDWYIINVPDSVLLMWTCESADFDWQLFILDLGSGCGGLRILAQAAGGACASGQCQAAFGPGTYAMFIAPQFGTPVTCGAAYVCTLSCLIVDFIPGDECSDPVALDIPSSTPGSTLGANPDPQASTCGTSVDAGGLWFTVTGTGTTITASLCGGTDYDSKIHVYCGTDCDDLFCVTGIDDFCGLASQVSFCSRAGQTYWILVEGFGGAQGDFQLDLSEDGLPCDNSLRCEATVVDCQKGDIAEGEFESGNGCGVPVDFYNGGCNSVPEVYSGVDCGQTVCGSGAFDGFTRDTDWYLIDITEPTILTWTMDESTFDWVLLIVNINQGCGALVVPAFVTGLAGQSGSATTVVASGTYVLFAAPNFTNPVDCPSAYRATLTCQEGDLPGNDECANAIGLDVPGSTLGTTLGAQPDPGAFNCGTGGGGPGVWYSITGTGTTITATTCSPNTTMDTKLLVYCGSDCDTLFCVAGNDDDGVCSEPGFDPPTYRSTVSFCSVAGQTYWVFVMGFGGAQGDFELILSEDGQACDGAARCELVVVNCQKGDVIEGEVESGGACGIPFDFYNGGCNSVPEVYSPIECGQTICGSGAYDQALLTRDTDWYTITVAESTTLTWTMLDSSFEWVIFILYDDCLVLEYIAFATGEAGESGVATAEVGPGTYRVFVASNFTTPASCPSAYRAQLNCYPVCGVKCAGGAPEGEDDCESLNGGCNSTPPVFSPISCCDTICGTVGFNSSNRDTDWYTFTNDTGSDVTFTLSVAAEFAFVAGYVEWQPGFEGSGDCARITGDVNPFIAGPPDCAFSSLTMTVGQGEHWLFIAPQFGSPHPCGGDHSRYVATLTFDGCGCGPDCNENGIPDSQDISSGTSHDCFDYAAAAGTRGGPNGIPDECECVADWNRDGIANSTDVSDFINTFFADQASGGHDGDINCDGTSNSTDVSDFINVWFSAQAGQLPFSGCTI